MSSSVRPVQGGARCRWGDIGAPDGARGRGCVCRVGRGPQATPQVYCLRGLGRRPPTDAGSREAAEVQDAPGGLGGPVLGTVATVWVLASARRALPRLSSTGNTASESPQRSLLS